MPLLLESLTSPKKEIVSSKFLQGRFQVVKEKENIKEIYAILRKGRVMHTTVSVHNCQACMLSKGLSLHCS